MVSNGDARNGLRKIFRSPSGKIFFTRKKALEFMMKDKGFPEEDMKLMASKCRTNPFLTSPTSTTSPPTPLQQDQTKYSTSDPSIPKGWSSKYVSNGMNKPPKKTLRSPQGQFFPSRKKALEFMLRNSDKFSNYKIQKMRQHLHPNVVIKDNEILCKDIDGGEVMKELPKEKEEDKTELENEDKEKEDKIEGDSVGKQGWQSDPKLPVGWLYNFLIRIDPSRSSGYQRSLKFKTSEGEEIESSWKAMKKMRSDTKYSNSVIESFVSFYREKKEECLEKSSEDKDNPATSSGIQEEPLHEESDKKYRPKSPMKKSRGISRYTEHPLLPQGWLLALYQLSKGGTLMRFKTPEGEIIHSKKKVLEMLRIQGHPNSEIDNFMKVANLKPEKENEELVEPETGESSTEDLEFSLVSEDDQSDDSVLDEETIMGLTEDDFEIVGDDYLEDSTYSVDGLPPPVPESENESVGPKISISLESFDILCEAFKENNTISAAETSSLSDLTSLPTKDVKWFFLKFGHIIQVKNMRGKNDQISDLLESVKQTHLENNSIVI